MVRQDPEEPASVERGAPRKQGDHPRTGSASSQTGEPPANREHRLTNRRTARKPGVLPYKRKNRLRTGSAASQTGRSLLKRGKQLSHGERLIIMIKAASSISARGGLSIFMDRRAERIIRIFILFTVEMSERNDRRQWLAIAYDQQVYFSGSFLYPYTILTIPDLQMSMKSTARCKFSSMINLCIIRAVSTDHTQICLSDRP